MLGYYALIIGFPGGWFPGQSRRFACRIKSWRQKTFIYNKTRQIYHFFSHSSSSRLRQLQTSFFLVPRSRPSLYNSTKKKKMPRTLKTSTKCHTYGRLRVHQGFWKWRIGDCTVKSGGCIPGGMAFSFKKPKKQWVLPLSHTDRSVVRGNTRGKWSNIFRLNWANQ